MSEEAWEEMHSEPELGIYGGSTKGKQVLMWSFGYWFRVLIFESWFLILGYLSVMTSDRIRALTFTTFSFNFS